MTVVFGDTQVTGRMLRALREAADLSIREVARRAGGAVAISNPHLSMVERGKREVSHAAVAAYERATGVRIDAHVLRELVERSRPGGVGRKEFETTSAVAMVAAGGLGAEHERRLLFQVGMLSCMPARVGVAEVAYVEQIAWQVRSLDLRYGGEVAGQQAGQLLRWAAGLRDASMTDQLRCRLHVAVGVLAQWAAWCAFDADRYEVSRALSMVALGSALRADEPDLRGHVLADVAAQQADLGNVADALLTVRLAEEDERTTPAVRCMLHGVRARLYAMLGERDHCLRQIGLVHEFGEPEAAPEWLGGWVPAHSQAVCGHAFARLAEVSDEPADAAEAHKLLATAAEELIVAGRLRAAALCLTSLARMHHRCGSPNEAAWWADRAQPLAENLRSARVARTLATARADHNRETPVTLPRTGLGGQG
jgi:transcriptional regulator with XRE-family HTH domain